MKKTNNFTLGIDMGTNSIGWAVVEHDDKMQPSGLIACGTRIFEEAVVLSQEFQRIRHAAPHVLHADLLQDVRRGSTRCSTFY